MIWAPSENQPEQIMKQQSQLQVQYFKLYYWCIHTYIHYSDKYLLLIIWLCNLCFIIGYGKFHYWLLLACGWANAADAVEIM